MIDQQILPDSAFLTKTLTSSSASNKPSTNLRGLSGLWQSSDIRQCPKRKARFLMGRFALLVLALFVGIMNAGQSPEGTKYLEENAKKEGVIVTDTGLQYKVLKKGEGTKSPLPGTPCDCHYAGQLIDGTEFDSSYKRGAPTSFAPNQVIKGWTQAMQMMHEGDKWELYIPSDLAYGDRGVGPIPGGAVLIFQMELIKIKGATKDEL